MITLNLTGKTALVTGSTGQLGRTMAITLAKCGADIILHYHNNKNMAINIQKEIENIGCNAYIVSADITDNKSVFEMRDTIEKEFKLPDIIVNNAVIQYEWTSILQQPIEDYESQFRSCVLHNVNMAKAFVPNMISKKYGRVIGINTECSMQSLPTQSAYVAGKRGMDGVLRILAKEIGENNITVNQVAPGWTISDKERQEGVAPSPEYTDLVPLRHRGTDQDIANAVAFLASDLACYIT
ncbi:MAG: SDR family oxidoreductase [Oscillospiraceae bacterium]